MRDSRGSSRVRDDTVRLFLVAWTALLMLLVLIAYWFTHDSGILLTTTIVGVAVPFVFRYYFSSRKSSQ